LMNSLCDPSHEAPSPACRGSWTPIARAASDRPSSPARAIVACPPAASDLSSSTADCRRLCVAPLPSTKRDPASLSDRVRWCFGRPSSRAPQPRSHRTPRPSPRPPRSTADPARSERNEGLHTGCGGVIRRSSKRHRRWLPRQESPNQSMLPKSRTRFTCFWGSPYCVQHALLMQIPGVDWVVAAVLIAEIGVDMSVFLSVYHLAAWAGVCPGNHESAGKQKSGRARKGTVHLSTMLVGAAMSAARTKGSYLKDKFHRLKARRGGLRAALAIAHKILVSAYHMLANNVPY